MKKLIDFDGMFDEKLAEYMEENAGKIYGKAVGSDDPEAV